MVGVPYFAFNHASYSIPNIIQPVVFCLAQTHIKNYLCMRFIHITFGTSSESQLPYVPPRILITERRSALCASTENRVTLNLKKDREGSFRGVGAKDKAVVLSKSADE